MIFVVLRHDDMNNGIYMFAFTIMWLGEVGLKRDSSSNWM